MRRKNEGAAARMLGLPLLALVLLVIFAATGNSIESILDRAIARNAQLQSQAMRLALEQALEETRNQLLILAAGSMGLCCVEMVRAKAAGVAFSRHPVDLRSNATVINGLWGLGETVVDGSGTPDQWLVSRATGKITTATIAKKNMRLRLERTPEGGIESVLEAVPDALRDVPCLSDAQARKLAAMLGLAWGPLWAFIPFTFCYGLGLGLLYPLLAATVYDRSTATTRSINSNVMPGRT